MIEKKSQTLGKITQTLGVELAMFKGKHQTEGLQLPAFDGKLETLKL